MGPDAQAKAAALQPGQIVLLENTRFEPGETKNDPALAKAMASWQASMCPTLWRRPPGPRLHRRGGRLSARRVRLSDPEGAGDHWRRPGQPQAASGGYPGGSKVSSKIGVINNLLEIADTIIIGGGMAYTFSAAQGGKVGDSCWRPMDDYAKEMVQKAKDKGVKLLLPVDTVCADKFAPDANTQVVKAGAIPTAGRAWISARNGEASIVTLWLTRAPSSGTAYGRV